MDSIKRGVATLIFSTQIQVLDKVLGLQINSL